MRKATNIALLGKNCLRLLLAVKEGRLVEPFSAHDADSILGIKHASTFLSSHRVGNPGANRELFVRVNQRPALYEIWSEESARRAGAGLSELDRRLALYRKRIRLIKTRYDLDEHELEYLLDQQDCQCAICGDPEAPLCVDHNHATGRVRGLLCTNCNKAIGLFKDDPSIVKAAHTYLIFSNSEKTLAEFAAWNREIQKAGEA